MVWELRGGEVQMQELKPSCRQTHKGEHTRPVQPRWLCTQPENLSPALAALKTWPYFLLSQRGIEILPTRMEATANLSLLLVPGLGH